MREPTSMDECVYHTIQTIGKGKARLWVLRENCLECGKALMSKPKDPKTGRFKTRSKEYICSECGHTEDIEEYAEKLNASIQYTCPKCEHKGELEVPFKRKKTKFFDEMKKKEVRKLALIFNCQKCNEEIKVIKLK
ncbi:MAG: hypothetical protein QGF74_00515 [Candidatus Nanoarchaeia archaeon]|mgnify:CR=1 FL=1|jgi:DNA-directed RNA polymerase subunit RPC12/RpoP|nr:hypothetical protein [Candidatus Nanoarchaeia archaeon]|tara:strand:- start:21258 stop:21665 length:408 start_codon:yes stop_codon:yes gene_type:complete